jgi:hypothetical protein
MALGAIPEKDGRHVLAESYQFSGRPVGAARPLQYEYSYNRKSEEKKKRYAAFHRFPLAS